eukprot:TRINITY_DN25451_c0_g1_i1.p1 TRINITY_DN25451_c0_g1~~TRINITY_DN25451_c0_g1_i1.p1  ORF type:complete len:140 (-),score=31.19 TRINITY_DN25451_c0_g1_i1:390-809(-)
MDKPVKELEEDHPSNNEYRNKEIQCYAYKAFGHMTSECANNRKLKDLKKPSLVATWEKYEGSGTLSFMAPMTPTTQSPKFADHDDLDMSEDEEEEDSEDTYHKMYQECERLALKVNELNKIIKDLRMENKAINQRYKEF